MLRAIEQLPHFLKLTCKQPPEQGPGADSRDEVAGLSDPRPAGRVVPVEGIVQRRLHETAERDRAVALNHFKELLFKGWHQRLELCFGEGLSVENRYM